MLPVECSPSSVHSTLNGQHRTIRVSSATSGQLKIPPFESSRKGQPSLIYADRRGGEEDPASMCRDRAREHAGLRSAINPITVAPATECHHTLRKMEGERTRAINSTQELAR